MVGSQKRWIRIDSQNFTMFSDAGEKKARLVAENLERFRAALSHLTQGIDLTSPVPTYVFVFKGERSFDPYSPGPDTRGFFTARPDANYIAINERPPIQPSKRSHHEHASYYWGTVYHEYAHFMIEMNFADPPFWLHEGLAEYYYTFRAEGDTLEVGRARRAYVENLRHPRGRWIPLEDLVSKDFRESDERRMAMAYAESWALTHFLLRGGRQGALTAYLENLRRGRSSKDAFRDAFGSDLDALDRDLQRYVNQPRFQFARIKVSSLEIPSVPAGTAMEPSEALYRLGMLALQPGDPQRIEFATEHFAKIIEDEPSHGGAHLGLALVREFERRPDEAASFFEKALRFDADDVTAHFFYGSHLLSRLAEADEAQVEQLSELAREEFRSCVELMPEFVEPYYLYGITYLYGSGDPTAGIPALEHARKKLPSRMDVALNLVFLYVSAEDRDGAREVVVETLLTSGPLLVRYLNRAALQNLFRPSLGQLAQVRTATDLIREALPLVPDAGLRSEIESSLEERFPFLEDLQAPEE